VCAATDQSYRSDQRTSTRRSLHNLAMDELRGSRLDLGGPETPRRCDVDWISILAFGALIFHHAVLAFNPWGTHLLLIWSDRSFPGANQIAELIGIWAIPLLFVALGMQVRRAVDGRSWRQLAGDVAVMGILPLALGTFAIGPLSLGIAFRHYYGRATYVPTPEHLWFLGSALIYVLLLLPVLIWMRRRPNNCLERQVGRLVGAGRGVGMIVLTLPVVLAMALMNPVKYAFYAFRPHGFVLGFILFTLGMLYVSLEETGKRSSRCLRFGALVLGCSLALVRLLGLWSPPSALLALESVSWIVAILGFASRHSSQPTKMLQRLSSGVLPVYILHLPVQVLVSSFLIPMGIPPFPKFLLLLALTLIGSMGLYLIVRRICWLRPLLGMEWTCGAGRRRQRETA